MENGAGRNKSKGSATRSFGSSDRVGHDSSQFYDSRLYREMGTPEAVAYQENAITEDVLDHLQCKSSENMAELPDNSVHLMVTSPPYNVGKDYDTNLTLSEYLRFLRKILTETYRTLVPGGRACINVANLGRSPYIPLNAAIAAEMIDIGYLMRGEIIWDKGPSAGRSTAWGSWMSASNPILRDTHEYILVFSKGSFSRPNPLQRRSTINKEQFLQYTKSIWGFNAALATQVGHPAPFPVELPYRLIQLYTYEGETVLDPFMGSGQTAMAALQAKRHYVGYEVDEGYANLAVKRIADFQATHLSPRLFEMEDDNTDDQTEPDSVESS